MTPDILPNIIAMVCSAIAIVELVIAIPKIGGTLGKILKLLSTGIFFSVFVHAAVEMASAFELIKEENLLDIMGILLTVGSVFFIAAGSLAIKTFKR